jgi:hypothetical protein
MVTVSPNATAALASATTNRVFIDQSGDNPNVNMTQEGSGNKAGSAARPVYLRGIDQTVVTRQIGATNEIMLEAVNATTGAGQGVNITIQQIGDSNVFRVDVIGNKHTQTIKVVGDGNTMDINQRSTGAAGSSVWVDLAGNSNNMTIAQTGSVDNVLNIKSVSNSGTFNIVQKN